MRKRHEIHRDAWRAVFWTLLLTLAGCGPEPPKAPLFGAPTPLPENVSPALLLCQIRDEFRELPMPLLERITYKGPWERRPIGAAPVRYRGFHRVALRAEGLAFLEAHARIELVASLAPMLIDPTHGGEAAVLLAGIPAGTDAQQSQLTRVLAQQVYDSGYRSPDRPGAWSEYAGRGLSSVPRLYGLGNTTSRIHARRVPGASGSLEAAIVGVLEDFETSVPRLPSSLYEAFEPPPLQGTVEEWARTRGPPELSDDARRFVERHEPVLAAMALFPLTVSDSSALGAPEHVLMWLLGLEHGYWPTVVQRATGNELSAPLTKAFRERSAEVLLGMCADKQETETSP